MAKHPRYRKATNGRRRRKKVPLGAPARFKPLGLKQTVYNLRRKNIIVNQVVLTTEDFVRGYSYNIAQLSNIVNFSSLFDSYRINCVVVRFTWLQNFAPGPNQSQLVAGLPRLFWCLDYDDSDDPINAIDVRQRQQSHEYAFSADKRTCRIKFRPLVQNEIFRSSGQVAFTLPKHGKNPWISFQHSDVPHFGLKVAIPRPGLTNWGATMTFELDYTFYFSVKGLL